MIKSGACLVFPLQHRLCGKKGIDHTKIDLREAASEAAVLGRWLDDGGTADHASEHDVGIFVSDDGIDLLRELRHKGRALDESVF